LPFAHQPRAQCAVARKQGAVVLFLISKRKRLLGADRRRRLRRASRGEPFFEPRKLAREALSATCGLRSLYVDRRQLRHRKGPARFRVVGLERERALVAGERFLNAIELVQHVAKGIVRRRKLRVDLERLAERGHCLLAAPELALDEAEVEVRLRMARGEPEQSPIALVRLVESAHAVREHAQPKQHINERLARGGVIRSRGQARLEVRCSALPVPE